MAKFSFSAALLGLGLTLVAAPALCADLAADKVLLDKVVSDLNSYGLAQIQLNGMMTAQSIFLPATSPLGQRLIDFVTLQSESAER